VNAAFGRSVVASSTCGSPDVSRHCVTTRHGGRTCQRCDDTQPALRHRARYLTDLNNPSNVTCWMSRPLDRSTDNVTLTLSLGKKFEVRVAVAVSVSSRHGTGSLGHRVNGSFGSSFTSGSPGRYFDPV